MCIRTGSARSRKNSIQVFRLLFLSYEETGGALPQAGGTGCSAVPRIDAMHGSAEASRIIRWTNAASMRWNSTGS